LRAQLVWKYTGCKTLGDYCDLYMDMDVMLLTDCLENFREIIYNIHELDPFHSYSAPGLSWQCGLKYSEEIWKEEHPNEKFSIELLTNYDALLMIEKGLRGGFSGVLGRRYAKANNYYLNDYDPKVPSSYLMYFDANNLYGWAMKQKLPYGDFKEQTPERYQELKKDKEFLKNHSFIVDVDLKDTNECKKKTHKMPLAPEKKRFK